jgi:hypothetical protein
VFRNLETAFEANQIDMKLKFFFELAEVHGLVFLVMKSHNLKTAAEYPS